MTDQVPSKDVTTCAHEAEFRMFDTLPCPWCVIDELKRGREELQRCLNHYQARFSLITNAWRSGDNSAVLDAVRKHITAKDCEDADRLVRASHEPPAVRRWDIRPALGDGVDFLVDPAGEWVKWEDVAPHLRAAQPPAPARCNCGAHAWPDDCVQIEDSRGRLHTQRGCQPGATSTKEGSPQFLTSVGVCPECKTIAGFHQPDCGAKP